LRRLSVQQKRTLLAVDELVARVIGRLKKLKESRRTLIVFMSDNGMLWGEHGLGGKRFPYTQSVKIPLLVKWPGHIRPRSQSRRMVANIDVAPTVYDAAGIQPAHVMDGRSLLARKRRNVMLLEHWEKVPWRSLRSRRFQYIEYFKRANGAIRFRELYNLKRDPWQLRNLLQGRAHRHHRAIAARLRRALMRRADCQGAECF
jgi:arylsulfatase A-like enzyme